MMRSDGDDNVNLEEQRDMYGFSVRPQHLEKYLEHVHVYKEEELHRSSRWARFLATHEGGVEQALQELKKLVWGGVPVSLRGELWQMFTGAKTRWRDEYYQELLARDVEVKWAGQIEKDLPRTFPGHRALGEDGLGSLRRMLTAYARHNPTVGYCQDVGIHLLFCAQTLFQIVHTPYTS